MAPKTGDRFSDQVLRDQKISVAVSAAEAETLFSDMESSAGMMLAVSGGPDSTALLWLAALWHKTLKKKPKLFAATVDHGLRKEAKREAAGVAKLAKKLRIPHTTLRWKGAKPKTGIQQSARQARYGLLVAAAKKAGATHILTAHTVDDQAETVLMRMARGSGIGGLGGMARRTRLDGLVLVRPLLEIPKARLVATCKAAKVPFAQDPSNSDPKFTRARLRPLMAPMAGEGLDARRLGILARRLRRADAALDVETDRVSAALPVAMPGEGAVTFPAKAFARLPVEIALRVLGRAVARRATEGVVELGKLEALLAALLPAALRPQKAPFRRTLAGASISVSGNVISVEAAPARRNPASAKALTKAAPKAAGKSKRR
jgi:tRNA(Ile)-lysidine synthase